MRRLIPAVLAWGVLVGIAAGCASDDAISGAEPTGATAEPTGTTAEPTGTADPTGTTADPTGTTGRIDWSSPVDLPPPERDDFRSEFVSNEEGYRFWPRSSSIVPGVAYRFDTGHCGLDFMTDLDGNFWRPIDPNGGGDPDFFFNQDVGAIALVDLDAAIYRSSTGIKVTLERLPGPVVTQLCL